MKLAICIPTHHGRAATLRVLLDSILSQGGVPSGDEIEICISDNASTDGTANLVAEVERVSPFPVRYHRFDIDRGAPATSSSWDIATAEWCWPVGSDDALLPGALRGALTAIRNNPAAVGITCNKVNFDKTLTAYHSVDHEIALPSHPERSRFLPAEEAVDQLAIAYSYMSGHLFSARHGAPWFIPSASASRCASALSARLAFASMASRHHGWVWLADYLIIQRLDSSSVMEAVGGRAAAYAEALTHDLLATYAAALGTVHGPRLRRP